MSLTPASGQRHTWKFFRTGGLDQVALETADDLIALPELDQKLWVALSCPIKGLQIDERTLTLIDSDHDGHIRVPEMLDAVAWAVKRLKSPASLLKGDASLPLSALQDATPEDQAILASAREIAARLGRKDALTPDDFKAPDKIFPATALNGDGVIAASETDDAEVQALIKDIVATVGGAPDRSGTPGVTPEKAGAFFDQLSAYVNWLAKSADQEIAVLGERTEPACKAVAAVRVKVEDYFARCRLAAFDNRAIGALNRQEAEFLAIAARDLKLESEEIAGFPLARVGAEGVLPLLEGTNPAWAPALATLHRAAVTPVFGADQGTLTIDEWRALNARLAPYETWMGSKGGAAVEPLGLDRARAVLAGNGREKLNQLFAADKKLQPHFESIAAVERIVRYHRDLRALLHNFVNFADLYSRDRYAVFQAGTLYLDSRSTELCIRVDAPNPIAAMSKAYIAYCNCTRAGQAPMTIAACFTQGDSDYLFVGRHGVFYDREGRDWAASITSVVDNPISIRQAFLAPYKKFVRFVEEQVAKRAAAADAAATTKLGTAAEKTVNVEKVKAEPKKIDIGTVAALGVAVGGITTAFGVILGSFFGLGIWMPLGVIGIILAISGPSMIIAWLKLRQRTLGPILEGNGWAINGRVKINLPFGAALTEMAQLPPGSRRSLEDPYEDKEAVRRRRQAIWLVLLCVLAAAAIWIRWDAVHHKDAAGKPTYFWNGRPVVPPPPASAPAAAATPATPAPATTPAPAPATK